MELLKVLVGKSLLLLQALENRGAYILQTSHCQLVPQISFSSTAVNSESSDMKIIDYSLIKLH